MIMKLNHAFVQGAEGWRMDGCMGVCRVWMGRGRMLVVWNWVKG
jgi:hypothetical protein